MVVKSIGYERFVETVETFPDYFYIHTRVETIRETLYTLYSN
jgi:hypothetical protein